MRTINWVTWRNSPICHVDAEWHAAHKNGYIIHMPIVKALDIVAYDPEARIITSPTLELQYPIAFYASLHIRIGIGLVNLQVAFDYDRYVYTIGKRLSSLPEHKIAHKNSLWLTIADRDYMFKKIME